METSIVGVGVSITDRFRTVTEDKSARIENLAPRAQKLDVKVTHRAYHNGNREEETVELTVTETEPGLQGDRSSAGRKPATVETGKVVQVPLFVNIGDKIRIDTRTGEYVTRVT